MTVNELCEALQNLDKGQLEVYFATDRGDYLVSQIEIRQWNYHGPKVVTIS